jgi:hypothetical protein
VNRLSWHLKNPTKAIEFLKCRGANLSEKSRMRFQELNTTGYTCVTDKALAPVFQALSEKYQGLIAKHFQTGATDIPKFPFSAGTYIQIH